ncbi:hypothetical protein LTR10_018668 [Elasticomyces elasticus]|uniref:DUF7908 domain-containing protein n=1 Tax=Exophiala sideris TaxID=1016849 RepID=A0ABR0JS31_9EURO|nr:hypothetical protein LTR10_018668 [Elasticomyces elasticus]KAK5040415.1 hypothetical protein LTS07_000913 [Exophiala sideris]KAK5043159.1 hypothetical protein LTR13_000930 [Exophiala sideris]KAK5068793.1 hypothetical protein LTR69_000914 [Exophiala sideris]KAK5186390.1 hypothetical protein LTR44_001446 [Eurotiomycetes sp. CCFEE 6388]
MAGAAVAGPLATISPCPQATSTTHELVTITSQYQTYTTCQPTTGCVHGICSTNYPFGTSTFVSSTIPNAWNGETASSTLVTAVDQDITVSQFLVTETRYVTPSPTTIGNTVYVHEPSPVYLTISKDFYAPYNQLGPLAIPGYEGSDLCETCDIQADGSQQQVVDVTECRAGPFGVKCLAYEETWISQSAPAVTTSVVAPFSTRWVAPSAGTYTITVTVIEPAQVITAPTQTITVPPQPWYTEILHTCSEALEAVDLTTIITKTIYFTVPYIRQSPTTGSWVPAQTGAYSGGDSLPEQGGSWAGEDPFGGNDWSNPSSAQNDGWQDWFSTVTSTTTSSSSSSASAFVTTSMSTTSSIASTSTTSTATTSLSTPSIGPFYIVSDNGGSKLRKRQSYSYVALESDNGFLVDDKDSAAVFFIDTAGFLVTGGQYVNADYSFSDVSFYVTEQPPITLAKFNIGAANELLIEDDVENHGFCFTSVGESILILFSAQATEVPCNPVTLYVLLDLSNTTTSTTTVATTSSNSTSSATTTIPTTGFTSSTIAANSSLSSSFGSSSSSISSSASLSVSASSSRSSTSTSTNSSVPSSSSSMSTSSRSSTLTSAAAGTSSLTLSASSSTSATTSSTTAVPSSGFQIQVNQLGLSKRDEVQYLFFENSLGQLGSAANASTFSIDVDNHLIKSDGEYIGVDDSGSTGNLLAAFDFDPSIDQWTSNSDGELQLAIFEFCAGLFGSIQVLLPNATCSNVLEFVTVRIGTTSSTTTTSASSTAPSTSTTQTTTLSAIKNTSTTLNAKTSSDIASTVASAFSTTSTKGSSTTALSTTSMTTSRGLVSDTTTATNTPSTTADTTTHAFFSTTNNTTTTIASTAVFYSNTTRITTSTTVTTD